MGGLVIGMSNLEMFVVIKTFPGLVNDIGQSGVFYLYSAACTFAAIFVFIFVEDNENVKRTDWQNWIISKITLWITLKLFIVHLILKDDIFNSSFPSLQMPDLLLLFLFSLS